ncbi:MAG: hypothetical protein CYG60_22670 [Actinobacteria bacterium]|nr:MAG: hypothetical protein CYG60_22670 [Actinomycetota bacterium]
MSSERRQVTRLLKLPEVAQRLGVSEKTARRYVKSGSIPSVFVGGAYRVSEEDVAKYLNEARVSTEEADSPKDQAPLPLEVVDTPVRGYLTLSHLLEDWRYLIESTAERHIHNASSNIFDTTEGAAAYSIAAYTETAQLFEIYLERLSPTIQEALPESLAELEAGKLARSIFRLEEAQEAISKAAKAAGVDLDFTQGLSEEELALIDEAVKEFEALPELERKRQEREAWKIVDRLAETSIANAKELAEEVRNRSSA